MELSIKYIELKSGYSDNGPAWIGKVESSKTGKTIYFNGHAFKGNGHGICSDLKTGEIYWISGVKRNEQDRHWTENGKIQIDKEAVDEYLKLVDLENLDLRKFELVDIVKTDKRFIEMEKETIDSIDVFDKNQVINGLSIDELKRTIEILRREESYINLNNGLSYVTVKKLQAEKLLKKLQSDN